MGGFARQLRIGCAGIGGDVPAKSFCRATGEHVENESEILLQGVIEVNRYP